MSGGCGDASSTDSLSLSSVGLFSNNPNGPSEFCGLPLAHLRIPFLTSNKKYVEKAEEEKVKTNNKNNKA